MMTRTTIPLVAILIIAIHATAQQTDSIAPSSDAYHFKARQLIVPGALVGVGVVGLGSDWLINQNRELRDELQESVRRKITIDDFTQFAPVAAMYGLDLAGVRGSHTIGGQTLLLGTAFVLMSLSVSALKYQTDVLRPDGSSSTSFPSGHTATAFMLAELLRREYWSVSPCIGVSGYLLASLTGFLRMYNNRHWLTDVLCGAGIGLLSVNVSYWLYPFLRTNLLVRHPSDRINVSPYGSSKEVGLMLGIRF